MRDHQQVEVRSDRHSARPTLATGDRSENDDLIKLLAQFVREQVDISGETRMLGIGQEQKNRQRLSIHPDARDYSSAEPVFRDAP